MSIVTLQQTSCISKASIVTLQRTSCISKVSIVTLQRTSCISKVSIVTLQWTSCISKVSVVTLQWTSCISKVSVVTLQQPSWICMATIERFRWRVPCCAMRWHRLSFSLGTDPSFSPALEMFPASGDPSISPQRGETSPNKFVLGTLEPLPPGQGTRPTPCRPGVLTGRRADWEVQGEAQRFANRTLGP